MPDKTRYETLAEISVALRFVMKSADKIEKVILGNGMHEGLLTAMVVTQKSLSDHLKECKESKDRKLIIKDKLFVGTALSIIGSIVVLLRSCTPIQK